MSDADLETAQQFQSAVEVAFNTGDFGQVVPLLAPDVECVMPQHTVYGVEPLVEELSRARPTERFDVEFESGDWKRLGDGRFRVRYVRLFGQPLQDAIRRLIGRVAPPELDGARSRA